VLGTHWNNRTSEVGILHSGVGILHSGVGNLHSEVGNLHSGVGNLRSEVDILLEMDMNFGERDIRCSVENYMVEGIPLPEVDNQEFQVDILRFEVDVTQAVADILVLVDTEVGKVEGDILWKGMVRNEDMGQRILEQCGILGWRMGGTHQEAHLVQRN